MQTPPFQPEKLRIGVISLFDVTDHVIYTYFSVCEYKNLCFQKKGSIKPMGIFIINPHHNFLRQLLKLLLYYKI